MRLTDTESVPLGSKNPTGAALRADVGGVTAVRGSPSDSAPTGPGLVLWSEAFDGDWSATVAGKTLRHVKPFGWANGFTASERGSVSINYDGQLRRYALIALQVLLVLAFLVLVWRSSATAPRASSPGPETESVTTPPPTPRPEPRRPPPGRGGPPARTPGPERRRLPVLIVVGACIAIGAAFGLGGTEASTTARAGKTIAAAVPIVAEPDTLSSTWYCAEGTGSPGGRADETIIIANVGNAAGRAVVTVMPGGQDEPESRRVAVPRGGQVRVPVSSILQTPEHPDDAGLLVGPGVVVEVFGGGSLVEHEIEGENDLAVSPCAREAGRDWYFAAGTTERGAEDNVALFNPFPDDAIVDLTFATDAGFIAPADLQALVVPRRSRVTVPVGNFVRRQAQVALHTHVRTGRIVAEQSLNFTAENETRRGLTPLARSAPPGVVLEPAGGGARGRRVARSARGELRHLCHRGRDRAALRRAELDAPPAGAGRGQVGGHRRPRVAR